MNGPDPSAADTSLQPPRRRARVYPKSDFDDPLLGDEDLVQAIDAVLAGACEFIDGEIGGAALARLVRRYREEVARATAAGVLAPVPRGGKGKPNR